MKQIIGLYLLMVVTICSASFYKVYAHEESSESAKDLTKSTIFVHMENLSFEPTEITINQGQTIVFENLEKEKQRWPASNIHPTHEVYPEFDPKRPLEPGESWEFTFDKPGVWRFHDHLYEILTGSITVIENEPLKPTTFDEKVVKDTSLKAKVSDFKAKLTETFFKTYFKLFPKEAEKELSKLSILRIAGDSQKITKLIRVLGPKKIMQKLSEEAGNGTKADCHQQAHAIGRLSYLNLGGKVFSQTSYDCISGFLHGAMEAFLKERGTKDLESKIDTLCSSFKTKFEIFECLHGSGHGVMAYMDYDMNKALIECKKFKDNFGQRSCYGGVFMENIIASQGQSLAVAHKTAWVNQDPLFPCNTLNEEKDMQSECYLLQTSRMLYLLNYDYKKVVNICLTAPEDMIYECFRSLGRDAAGGSIARTQSIMDKCNLVPQEKDYYDACILGAMNIIVDSYGPNIKDQAKDFCLQVPYENSKNLCQKKLKSRENGLKTK